MRGQTGANRRWGASTRKHKKGAPVTMSRLTGIFVHAKIMVIDDIFVSIGFGIYASIRANDYILATFTPNHLRSIPFIADREVFGFSTFPNFGEYLS